MFALLHSECEGREIMAGVVAKTYELQQSSTKIYDTHTFSTPSRNYSRLDPCLSSSGSQNSSSSLP
jgi:hypothetical protein